MKIYNEDKTVEIDKNSIDLTKGYLKQDYLCIRIEGSPEIEEVSHTERIPTKKKNPDGTPFGYSIMKIIDVPYKPAIEPYYNNEEIQVYILYSDKEIIENEIIRLKNLLNESDYKAIKHSEGLIPEEEYESIKLERQSWRDRINELEAELSNLEGENG